MAKYAYKGTEVPAERSIARIKDLLYKHGAVATQVNEAPEKGVIQFLFSTRVKMDGVDMQRPFKIEVKYGKRKPSEALRMIYYHLKAQFDAIDWGLFTLEEEFLPYMLVHLPGGKNATVAEVVLPDLRKGILPPYFEGLGGDKKMLEE